MPARRKTSASSSAGFTLVEMMMAMLVLTVGLLGLLQSINVAYRYNLGNRLREQALLLGEEQMIAFRNQAGSGPPSETSTVVRPVGGAPKSFTVVREYQNMQDAEGKGGARRLKVTVGWSVRGEQVTHVVYSLKKL